MTTPPQQPIRVKGSNGASVTFDGWTVTVHHRGRGLGDASVPINQLSGVELRPAGILSAGMFTILVAGAIPPRQSRAVNRNPLSLWLTVGQNREFEQLRDTLLRAIAAQHQAPSHAAQPPAPVPYPVQQGYPPQPPAPSLTDELHRLGQMVQQGLLSQAEFEQAKAHLLGGGRP